MKIEEVLEEADKALYSLKIEDAIIYLETALEINPNNIEALIKLSKIALTRDEKIKALKYIEKTENLDSESTELLFERASILQALKQYERSLNAYDKFLIKEPDNYFAKLNVGIIYIQQEKYEEAQEIIDEAIKIDPDNVLGYLDKAKLYEKKGEIEKALEICNSIIKSNPKLQEPYIRKAGILLRKNRLDEIIKLYDEAIKENADNNEFYALRAEIKYEKGDKKGAVEDYNILIAIEENSDYYERLYEILLEERKYKEIEILLINYKNSKELYEEALNLEGKFSMQTGDINRAGEACKKLMRAYPKNRSYKYSYVFILETKKKYKEALKMLDEIEPLEENEDKFYLIKTKVLKSAKKYDDVQNEIDKKYKRDKNITSKMEEEAYLLRDKKEYDEMIKACKIIIKKNENAETTKRVKLEVAIAYFMKKEYDKSIKYYNEIIKNEKDNKAYLYRNIGLSYLKQKKYKEAIMNIDKALELDEQYVEAKLNKAEALEGMKDYEGAFLIYEHIIKDMNDYSYYEEAHKMLKKMKKYEKALEYLKEAEKYYGEDERLYIDKAKLYVKIKNYDQALEEIEKGYRINPKSKEVQREKEKIEKKLGK